ncbi:hypothetical protein ACIPJK_38890 [Streptomyces roseus]|uniref:hypothetical protein n=1 Tax=Streptomyces roseus TaxID=66430 RepID=UPI003815E764
MGDTVDDDGVLDPACQRQPPVLDAPQVAVPNQPAAVKASTVVCSSLWHPRVTIGPRNWTSPTWPSGSAVSDESTTRTVRPSIGYPTEATSDPRSRSRKIEVDGTPGACLGHAERRMQDIPTQAIRGKSCQERFSCRYRIRFAAGENAPYQAEIDPLVRPAANTQEREILCSSVRTEEDGASFPLR